LCASIEVESEQNKGSTFTVTLPLSFKNDSPCFSRSIPESESNQFRPPVPA
jgi:hypothetical protein